MAGNGDGESLSQLEREAETTRAGLIDTVDTLRSRVSPQAIKADLKDYARDSGQQLISSLERRARENPLQAVAVAAGLAYPLWRILGKIPAPILLVGAGIALSQRGAPSAPLPGNPGSADGIADKAVQTAQDVAETVAGKASQLKQTVFTSVHDARGQASALGAKATETITETARSAKEVAANLTAAASGSLTDAYRSGADLASETTRQVSDGLIRAKDTLAESFERNPLVVGGIGLLIGGLIASVLPVTRAENRAFGATADELKDRARNLASEGVAAAKSTATEVYQDAVAQASAGLSPDTARTTVREIADKVRTAAKKATDAIEDAAAPSRPAKSIS